MTHLINTSVSIKDTKEIKKIVDKEFIYDTWIYYMEDKTSYSENQLQTAKVSDLIIDAHIKKSGSIVSDKFIEDYILWMRNKEKLKMESITNFDVPFEHTKTQNKKNILKSIILKYFPSLF